MLLRRSPLLLSLALFCAACSTPLSPYSQVDESLDEDGEETEEDAGVRDAGGVRDSGIGARDAGRPRDASVVSPGRDAGAGSGAVNCMRVPTAGVATLFTNDCLMRRVQSCAGELSPQQFVNQRLSEIARKCESPDGATLGVVLGANGCPSQLRYQDMRVFGAVSRCMQDILESERYGCSLTCALIGTTLDLR